MRVITTLTLGTALCVTLAGCGNSTSEEASITNSAPAPAAATAQSPAPAPAGPAAIDQARYVNAASEPENWINYGGTWKEQRFSTLDQIDDSNVDRLGLAWFAELGTLRGVVATPLVIDGVLYNTSSWNITTAYNAATGEVLWTYDPEVPPEYASVTCCGVVSRGLAAWNGKIIIATLDGRLIALDATNGKPFRHARHRNPRSGTGYSLVRCAI